MFILRTYKICLNLPTTSLNHQDWSIVFPLFFACSYFWSFCTAFLLILGPYFFWRCSRQKPLWKFGFCGNGILILLLSITEEIEETGKWNKGIHVYCILYQQRKTKTLLQTVNMIIWLKRSFMIAVYKLTGQSMIPSRLLTSRAIYFAVLYYVYLILDFIVRYHKSKSVNFLL